MSFIIKCGTFVLEIIYGILKLLPAKKKILFLSRQSDSPSLDIKLLAGCIRESHPDYQVIILCKKLEGGIFSKIGYCFHMLRQMYHLATSEAVILDSYAILVSLLTHKKSLLVIQMWHSTGTMKKFGYSILDMPEGSSSKIAHAMKMHRNYDYILCAGEGYKSHLAEGFDFPEDNIVILPLPRVEILQDEEYSRMTLERIYKKFPHLSEKKNILYVPTFRKDSDEHSRFVVAVTKLQEAFEPYSNDYNLIIKAHPLTGYSNMYDSESSFDMLFAADYVISDYSCIMYEAAVLHKPLFFYTYDYREYMSRRDIYMDYPREIPNSMCTDPKELMSDIDNNHFNMEKQESFLNKYVSWNRPHITEDIVDFIFNHMKK